MMMQYLALEIIYVNDASDDASEVITDILLTKSDRGICCEDLCPVDIFYHLIAIRGIFILKHPVNINI